jgi:superfamily II DNA/RNA helicase
MSTSFAQLGLREPLVRALASKQIVNTFPIQEAAIPHVLARRDIQGMAPTGSGKTLAFGLPILETIESARRDRPRALVLTPTRELAEQISTTLGPLAKVVGRQVAAIYGGVSYGPQRAALRRGVDVLVATPGRLEDLIAQRSVDLSDVTTVVVDEADRMADMGFLPSVRRILNLTSPRRHTMLFSATLDGDVAVLSRDFQNNPVRVETGDVEQVIPTGATHHFWRVEQHDRLRHTADIIKATGRSIVFTRTRHGADRLSRQLAGADVNAVAMHGGRSQSQRTRALREFSTGRAHALIATDVAARGIHVDDVATVIHFDVPGDEKDYLHRSGRTARAGAGGTVVTMVMGNQERDVRRMQRILDLDSGIVAPNPAHLGGMASTKGRSEMAKPPVFERPAARRPVRDDRSGSQSIYVGNLPWTATASDLEALVSRFGLEGRATVVADRRNGRSKGFGFIELSGSDAATAVATLQSANLGGRQLKVRPARD